MLEVLEVRREVLEVRREVRDVREVREVGEGVRVRTKLGRSGFGA